MLRTTLVPVAVLLCIFVCGVTGAAPAAAATYHVIKTGSDSNSCSSDAPCLTIAHGLSMLSAGDTLVIHTGTYAENNLQPPGGDVGIPRHGDGRHGGDRNDSAYAQRRSWLCSVAIQGLYLGKSLFTWEIQFEQFQPTVEEKQPNQQLLSFIHSVQMSRA